MEVSGRESTGRIKDAMAALVALLSSRRSVEPRVHSCSRLEAVAEADEEAGGAAETTECDAQHEEGEEDEEERSVVFFLAEAIVKGLQARQIHRSKSQYNLLTYSKTFSVDSLWLSLSLLSISPLERSFKKIQENLKEKKMKQK